MRLRKPLSSILERAAQKCWARLAWPQSGMWNT